MRAAGRAVALAAVMTAAAAIGLGAAYLMGTWAVGS